MKLYSGVTKKVDTVRLQMGENEMERDVSYVKIGVDTDDVILEYNSFMKEKGKKFFEQEVKNKYGYDLADIFDISDKQRTNFWLKYLGLYMVQKVNPDIKKTLNEYVEKGYEVNNITARVFTTKKGIIGWIFRIIHNAAWKANGLKINGKRYFCSEKMSAVEKAMICRLRGIDFMFEDKIDNIEKILELSSLTTVFCITRDHNVNYYFNNKRCVRIESLQDPIAKKMIDDKNEEYKEKFSGFFNIDGKPVKKSKSMKSSELQQIKGDYFNNNYFLENMRKMNLATKLHQKYSYNLAYYLIAKPYEFKNRIIYLGEENIPYNAGYLVSFAPHVAHTDHIKTTLLFAKKSRKKQLYYLAANEFKSGGKDTDSFSKKLKKWALSIFDIGLIYIDRSSLRSKIKAYKLMKKRILLGEKVVICPEGTRGEGKRKCEKELLEFQGGVCKLAKETKAPIIPVSAYKNIIIAGKAIFVDDELKSENLLKEVHRELLEKCVYKNYKLEGL